jgi:hypothetical protein
MFYELFIFFNLVIPDLIPEEKRILINKIQMKIVIDNCCRKICIVTGSIDHDPVFLPEIKAEENAYNKNKNKNDREETVLFFHLFKKPNLIEMRII